MRLFKIGNKAIVVSSLLAVILIALLVFDSGNGTDQLPAGKEGKVAGYDKPEGYYGFFRQISTSPGAKEPGYAFNYAYRELKNALKRRSSLKLAGEQYAWVQRGPGNVGGRTRDVLIDPDDPLHMTWYAASASGGVWKTIDGGMNWRELTDHLPNLATNCIAMAPSNHNVLYVGTGEGYGGFGMVNGNGILRSVDKGENWEVLASTLDTANTNFRWVNRIVVNENNEAWVLAATNSGLFRSEDGGTSWDTVFYRGYRVQDMAVNPMDGNTVYAAVNRLGIIRSYNFGSSWDDTYEGIGTGYRFSVTVSPADTNYIFTSVEAPNLETHIYISTNGAESWRRLHDHDFSFSHFLGTQGWFNNVITAHPFEKNKVYLGGVNLGMFEFKTTTRISDPGVIRVDTVGTGSFLAFINFGGEYLDGALTTGLAEDAEVEEEDFSSVEIRFGPGITQLAHRFTVPAGEGAGVPPEDYVYRDYVQIPFQVWNSETGTQLMVSFRDQDNNGEFNLTRRAYNDDISGREYIYIHAFGYATTPGVEISQDGGHFQSMIYFFWPTLATDLETEDWKPGQLPGSGIFIRYGSMDLQDATTTVLADENRNTDLHVDHHDIEVVVTNAANKEFLLVNANDGGLGISSDKGISWKQLKNNYPTTQFYGVAKKLGAHEYIGGMQDNGTWQSSPGEIAHAGTAYLDRVAGDGFEALWHPVYPHRILASTYYNGIRLSNDGGENWNSVTNGIQGDGPFITRLSNSSENPDLVFAVGNRGVYRHTNFCIGRYPWSLVELGESWAVNNQVTSSHNVKVSLADPSIVWAGGGMFRDPDLNIFVSEDYGQSFDTVARYTGVDEMGYITSIATHPSEPETAYLLFSIDHKPKILRTTDLGLSWEDISGFDTDSSSKNGFPDVMVYSLMIFPYETEKLWAGTEIGIFESTDNGVSWHYADNGLPAVSVWQMFMQDQHIVVATHGRGIWSAPQYPGALRPEKELQANLLVYPNPAVDFVDIVYESDRFGPYTLKIYSLDGKLLLTKQGTKETGKQTGRISVSSLGSGTYIISYEIGKVAESQRFVVQ